MDGNKIKKEQFPIIGMHCVSCALTVEKALKKAMGVKSAEVNFATEKVSIEYENPATPENLKEVITKTGYQLITDADEKHKGHEARGPTTEEHDHHRMLKEAEIKSLREKFILGAVLSVFVILLSFPDYFQSIGKLMPDSLRLFVLYPFFGILLNPILAGAAMALSSVSVVLNSLRLKYE